VSEYRKLNRRVTISIDTLADIQKNEPEIKGDDLVNNVTKNKSAVIVILIIIAVITIIVLIVHFLLKVLKKERRL
jgi:hypothetical protein